MLGQGDGFVDAFGTAEGETVARGGEAASAAGVAGCAVAEGETFAALAAGVLPGKPVPRATEAAGVAAAAGIPINSRCKLLSLALRRA
jgi:hypothetical protein